MGCEPRGESNDAVVFELVSALLQPSEDDGSPSEKKALSREDDEKLCASMNFI